MFYVALTESRGESRLELGILCWDRPLAVRPPVRLLAVRGLRTPASSSARYSLPTRSTEPSLIHAHSLFPTRPRGLLAKRCDLASIDSGLFKKAL